MAYGMLLLPTTLGHPTYSPIASSSSWSAALFILRDTHAPRAAGAGRIVLTPHNYIADNTDRDCTCNHFTNLVESEQQHNKQEHVRPEQLLLKPTVLLTKTGRHQKNQK